MFTLFISIPGKKKLEYKMKLNKLFIDCQYFYKCKETIEISLSHIF